MENERIELNYDYNQVKIKIDSVSEKPDKPYEDKGNEDLDRRNFYYLGDNRCLEANQRKYKLFMQIGHWKNDVEFENVHVTVGSNYKKSDYFAQFEISQSPEDDDYIYLIKNIEKLAGKGAICRLNNGLHTKEEKRQRRTELVNRLNGKTLFHEDRKWLIVSKINKHDLLDEAKHNQIFYTLVKDILNYAFTIEDIIAESKANE